MFDISKLKVAHDIERFTKGRAPYKVLVLLSYLRLSRRGELDLENLDLLSGKIVATYRELWDALGYGFTSNPTQAIAYLRNDGIYSILAKADSPSSKNLSINLLIQNSERIALAPEILAEFRKDSFENQLLSDLFFDEKQKQALKEALNRK